MGKLKDLTIDIESGPDMVIIDHKTGKTQAVDIKTNHVLDAQRYALMSGRQMGKSAALGMMYGAPGYGKSGPWRSMWSMLQEIERERKEQDLARKTEMGAILYGKD